MSHGGEIVRLKPGSRQKHSTCGEGEYRVQLYSRRARLVNEFRLDKQANNLPDIETAESFLRQTLVPCDFSCTTVSLISGEGTKDERILQFDPQQV